MAAQFESHQTTYRLRYAVAALRLGRIDEAMSTLRGILDEQPDSAMAHKMLGVLLFENLGREDEGRSHLLRALRLDPEISDAERIRQLLRVKEP
jgi:Flp pilus assembly protein TadD